jgi:hypothetical protein
MLMAVRANDEPTLKAAIDGGADVVIVEAADAAATASLLKGCGHKCAGALLQSLDEAGSEALREAGCDFVISPLGSTESAAVDAERMGQVVVASGDLSDTTLRALGPLGLDALYVEAAGSAMTLADQLELVRIASFAASPLLVALGKGATPGELRVLRDSGTAGVVAPAGSSKADLDALDQALKAVPVSKRGRRDGREMALVPSVAGHAPEDDEVEEPE